MASQAPIGNLQAGLNAEIVIQSMKNLKSLAWNDAEKEAPAGQKKAEAATEMAPKIYSQSVEFVALPGRTEKLCREIPLAMRQASGESNHLGSVDPVRAQLCDLHVTLLGAHATSEGHD